MAAYWVHQNRGLNPHIEDIARRLATANCVALAVDFLSPLGGTPADENAAMRMFAGLDPARTVADARAGLDYLRGLPEIIDKTAAIGFCWGGGVVNRLAVADPGLKAGIVYYGTPGDPADAAKVQASMLLHYADPALDKRNAELAPAWADALKAHGRLASLNFYSGAQHAFNDDTQAARYDKEAADLAWQRTLEVLAKALSRLD